MPSAEERFHAKVVRRGIHQVWIGSHDRRGVGMVRIDGKLKTVQRAAWEFTHGPLEPGARVNTCAAERACVTVTHLSLSPTTSQASPAPRRSKGTGSLREIRPDTWELSLVDRATPHRRHHQTVHGPRRDAEAALERLRRLVHRDDLGDLRVRELVGRYLEHTASPADGRDRALLSDVVEPTIGDDLAALITTAHIENALETTAATDTPLRDARDTVRLLRRTYRWARDQQWHHDNPATDIDTRWLGR